MLRLDVTFELREGARVLFAERSRHEWFRHLHKAGYLDREDESTDDVRRAFDRLEGVADVDVDVRSERPLLDQHRLMEADMFRRIVFRDAAGSHAGRSPIEIRRAAERLGTRQPAAIIRHVGDEIKDGPWRAYDPRREYWVRGGHRSSLSSLVGALRPALNQRGPLHLLRFFGSLRWLG